MAKEIERKFLVKDGWRDYVTDSEHLCDGLLVSTRQRKVRIRTSGEKATLAIKDRRQGAERNEFEFTIPIKDARELLAEHCEQTITKTRHHISHNGHAWTVDEYHGIMSGVVIAEVELKKMRESFDKPQWLGKEVTDNPRYRKRNLVARSLRDRA